MNYNSTWVAPEVAKYDAMIFWPARMDLSSCSRMGMLKDDFATEPTDLLTSTTVFEGFTSIKHTYTTQVCYDMYSQ
ncbi:MAG: hypothetical protein WA323_23240 [Candidatus Nitrosopolaris sp.]